MAIIVDGRAEIRLDEEERKTIGRDFKSWIEGVEQARTQRNREVWQKAFDNYEGKAPIKQFPFPGASNARIPITPSHANTLAARIYNAATAQEPSVLTQAGRQGSIIARDGTDTEIPYEWWAERWGKIYEWIEKAQIDIPDMLDELILTFIIYGDAYLYLPWEVEETMDVDLGPRGEIVKTKRTLLDQPNPHILHPKDVIVASFEKDPQTARRIGIHWDLDLAKLNELEAQGIYEKSIADKLREKLELRSKNTDMRTKKEKGSFVGTYYKEWGGNFINQDDFEREVKRRIGVSQDEVPNALKMVRVFARVDLDGDGIPEEAIYDVEKQDGFITYARYNNILHRKRPLIHFWYEKRPGEIYNRGVPEMLMNIQKILDQSVRDLLDNNKVANTKIYVGKKGGPLKSHTKIYPSRLLLLDNPKEDFMAVDMGSGRINTTVNDISLMQQWGERLTGVTDFNLGQERRSRTPATTTIALLEETNKRIDKTIRVFRKGMKEFWWQTAQLYLQNGDPEQLAKISGLETGDEAKFITAWAETNIEDFRQMVEVVPEISSASLNKAVERQESMAMFQQVVATQDRLIALANSIGGAAADPAMKKLFVIFAKATKRSMDKVLGTFPVRNREDFNPDIVKIMEEVTSVPLEAEQDSGNRRSNPAQAASGLVQNQPQQLGAGASPAEPVPGLGRIPGQTPGS